MITRNLQQYPENELREFQITMTHTITVHQTVRVKGLDRIHAESIAAGQWKDFPRNKSERERIGVKKSSVDFITEELVT